MLLFGSRYSSSDGIVGFYPYRQYGKWRDVTATRLNFVALFFGPLDLLDLP